MQSALILDYIKAHGFICPEQIVSLVYKSPNDRNGRLELWKIEHCYGVLKKLEYTGLVLFRYPNSFGITNEGKTQLRNFTPKKRRSAPRRRNPPYLNFSIRRW